MSAHARTLLSHLRRLASPAVADAALLTRWTEQRDEAAFAELVARHGPMVLGLCRRILGDWQHAEDAFQATFLVLARKAARVRPEALASFLYGVALRLARKARGAVRRSRLSAPPQAALEPADPQPHPLDVLSGRELLALLDAEITRLPEVYRLPLLLCVLQGRSVEEAARTLGWSAGSVRGRLTRGRERLRERLTRRGLGLSLVAVALLAPAALPPRLLADAVRHLAAPASTAVNALAASATSALKVKLLGLGVLLAVALGLGAAMPSSRAPEPPTPSAPPPAAPSQAKDEPRRDRYGDPLPPGAVVRLGSLRFRAPGEIVSLAFAPDNKALVVSARGGMYLFDALSGKRLRRIPSASPDWRADDLLVISPDGKQLIGRGHKTVGSSVVPVVRVWELAGGRQTHEYDIGPWLLWVGWSPKGQALAIRVEDKKGALHLHDLAVGRSRHFVCAKPYKYPSGFISRDPPVACSPRGGALAVPDADNVIHVWDAATGRERCTILPKGESIYTLTFSPDGSRLVTTTSKAVQTWDAAKGKAVHTVDANMNYGPPVFAADGKTLAIAQSPQTIRFWETATGKERGRIQDKSWFSGCFTLSASGKWLVTAAYLGSAFHVWDVATGKRQAEPMGHTNRPYGSFSPDGRCVATGGSSDGGFRIWDAATGEQLASLPRRGMARDCAFSADGRSLFASWSFGPPALHDPATGKQQHVFPLDDPDRPDAYQSILTMHLSGDGKTLVTLSYYYPKKDGAGPRYGETLITGWDTSTRKQLFQRRRPRGDAWLTLSADGSVLAAPSAADRDRRELGFGTGAMRLEDVRTDRQILTLPILKGQNYPVTFSADGRLLASNNFYRPPPGKDGKPSKAIQTLRLWETMTAAEVLSLPAADFLRVAFSLDNRMLALAAPSREIVVWDIARRRESRRFKGFDAEVIGLSFSPDGRRLLSGLADSTLLIWDVGPAVPAGKLGTEAAAKTWADLANLDAPLALRARGALASAPEEAIALLIKHLHPTQPADPQRLRRLLAELESEQFTVREKAQEELQTLGGLAEPVLRKTLESKPTLEVRRRAQAILERLRGPVTQPGMLQSLRAVAVLEDIGTAEARRLLEELAKGAAEARLTREAKASLKRLAWRGASAHGQ